MAQKPSIPKGTRDFSPAEMAKRNNIFDTIKQVFALHGFRQIETPAMENLSTLMGKYGEEGDKLLFKILNSGDFLKNASDEQLLDRNCPRLTSALCEKGLRYDLTVPFARFVVQHRGELQFPFKRFQIQPVWRADRPQKGRYREFYQCDADVIGTDSLLNEIDLLQIIDDVFQRFGINITIKLNNRKVLSGIAEVIGEPDKIVDITVAIDKIDKIGIDNVNAELIEKGISQAAVDQLQPLLTLSGSNNEKLECLEQLLATSEIGKKGIEELRFVIGQTDEIGINATLELDVSLARGLNYYTGTIIEVKANDVQIGSITGGGRYDNLAEYYTDKQLPGVGISIGLTRLFYVLGEQGYLNDQMNKAPADVLILPMTDDMGAAIKTATALRESGIRTQLYSEQKKFKHKIGYADKLGIPFVIFLGEDEINAGVVAVKDMESGEQVKISLDEAAKLIHDGLAKKNAGKVICDK